MRLLGLEPFRSSQILDWVYKKCARDFNGMSNLSAACRETLAKKLYISGLKLLKEQVSQDATRKFLFELEDGESIESVFIPSANTDTACISSQVGCRFACSFCASGKKGFVRNLLPAEMVNQVLSIREVPLRITNIVFMGIGEPLDNYDNVLKAARLLNAPYGLNIGQRKITISTAGVVPGIRRLAGEDLQVELSISLHGANDKMRSGIMGINNKYPIKELIAASREYIIKKRRQVTFEYVLIEGLNDSKKDAEELAALIRGMLAKVNLIPLNAVEGLGYAPPGPKQIKGFKDILDKKGITSIVRATRGMDISASCGQLKLSHKQE